jgi:alpha-ketoglutarate-dependent taurine dioxygenase
MHPTIELENSGHLGSQEIRQINYSPPFQAPLPLNTPPEFYSALSTYSTLLDLAENTFKYTLKEGDAVLFDNRRVLHARTAFSDKAVQPGEQESEPNRWLKGCYIEPDTLHDKGRHMRASLKYFE